MSVRSEVEQLMRLDMNFRDSDRALVLQVWKAHGLELTSLQIDKFRQVPGADVIMRRRREFSLKYPASEKVTEHRYKQFKEMREEFGKVRYPGIKKIERRPSLWSRLTGRKV